MSFASAARQKRRRVGEGLGSVAPVGPVVDRPQVGPGYPPKVDRVQDLGVAGYVGGCLGVEDVPGRPVAEAAR
eukprot:6104975-Lingulodinium_polyedra.AAC.1